MSDSEKALKQFEKKAEKITTTTSKIGSSSALAAKGMGKLRGQTINGNAAMTAFSRTIQDAPFGIMGVSNNITNLTEQFGYLKNKTGSSGGALKAMLKDLKGFGGITLAISLVTSALLIFGDKIFATKDKVKELKAEQDKLTKSLDDYIFGLSAVDKARLKGAQSAQKELTTLNLLKSQIEDTRLSTEKRLEAVNEMRRIYPSYLKDMSDEDILNQGLSTTYDTLTTSILNRAKATAAFQSLVKNNKKLIPLEEKLKKITDKKNKAETKYNAVLENNKKSVASYRGAAADRLERESKAQTALNELVEKENKLIAKRKTLKSENSNLEKIIIDLGIEIKDKPITKFFVDFRESYKDEKDYFEDWVEENPITIADNAEWKSIDWEAYFNNKAFEEKQLELKAKLETFNSDLSNMLNGSKLEGLSNFGSAIGNAIANGQNVLQAAGSSLLGSLGDIMVKYGKLILAFGLASEALKEAMKNPFGGGIAAVVAGVALIAIGSAIKSAASSNLSSSGGSSGGGGGSVSNDTSTYSPSSSGFSGQSSSSGSSRVVFEIQGTKLVGVLSNTLERNRALGGSLSIT